jgi:hypothetical protein
MPIKKSVPTKQPKKAAKPAAKKSAKVTPKDSTPSAARRATPPPQRPSPPKSTPTPKLFDRLDAASGQFPGALFLASGQASLNGTLLLLDGVSEFSAAVAAAAQALQNQGFQSGQSIVVTGRTAVVHLAEHPITVIVMTGASPGN